MNLYPFLKSNIHILSSSIFSKCRSDYVSLLSLLPVPELKIAKTSHSLQKQKSLPRSTTPTGPVFCLPAPQISSLTLIFLTIWASATLKIWSPPAKGGHDLGCGHSFTLIPNIRHLHMLFRVSFIFSTYRVLLIYVYFYDNWDGICIPNQKVSSQKHRLFEAKRGAWYITDSP